MVPAEENEPANEILILKREEPLALSSNDKINSVSATLLVQRTPPKKSEDHVVINMDSMEEYSDEQQESSFSIKGLFSKIQSTIENTWLYQYGHEFNWDYRYLLPENPQKIMIFSVFGIFVGTMIYLGT